MGKISFIAVAKIFKKIVATLVRGEPNELGERSGRYVLATHCDGKKESALQRYGALKLK